MKKEGLPRHSFYYCRWRILGPYTLPEDRRVEWSCRFDVPIVSVPIGSNARTEQHADRRRRHVKLRAIIAADKMGVQERHNARVVPHLGKPGLTLMTQSFP